MLFVFIKAIKEVQQRLGLLICIPKIVSKPSERLRYIVVHQDCVVRIGVLTVDLLYIYLSKASINLESKGDLQCSTQ